MAAGAKIKNGFLFGIGLLFLWALYSGFYRVLTYLREVPLLGPILVVKLLSMVFLTFLAMLVLSNVITSFGTIYFSSDLAFLLSTPFPFRSIFGIKFLETLIYSSWMVVLAFSPFLLAYGKTYSLKVPFYLQIVFVLIPFLVIAAGAGVIFSLILMHFFPTRKTRDILLVLAVFLGGGLYLLFRFLQPESLVKPEAMGSVLNYLAMIRAPTSKFLPSFWITQAVAFATHRDLLGYIQFFSIILSVAIALVLISFLLASRTYYSNWATAQEGSGQSLRKDIIGKVIRFFSQGFSRQVRALLEKDTKLFFRDTGQWSQLFLLGALVIVYLFNIYKLPLDTVYLKSLISFLNIGLAGFVLAALALRFVYPAVSLEGSSFWIIQSSPLSLRRFLKEKFWISFFPLLILGGFLVLVSNLFLKADIFMTLLSLGSVEVMVVGLTSLALGMGAIYPKFHVENISQVESSLGGILFMIYALFYVGVIIGLEALPVRSYFQYSLGFKGSFYWPAIAFTISAFVIVNLIIIWLPLHLGKKALLNYEE
jgi:ABC-2 type transport system permease protein